MSATMDKNINHGFIENLNSHSFFSLLLVISFHFRTPLKINVMMDRQFRDNRQVMHNQNWLGVTGRPVLEEVFKDIGRHHFR